MGGEEEGGVVGRGCGVAGQASGEGPNGHSAANGLCARVLRYIVSSSLCHMVVCAYRWNWKFIGPQSPSSPANKAHRADRGVKMIEVYQDRIFLGPRLIGHSRGRRLVREHTRHRRQPVCTAVPWRCSR